MVNEIAVVFHSDKTYEVKINGEPVGDTVFRYQHGAVTEINAVQFSIASRAKSASRVYIDNITVNPISKP